MRIPLILSIIAIVAIHQSAIGQFKTSEIALGADNDFYNPINEDERLYTLGFDIIYRHIPRDEIKQKNHPIRLIFPQMHYLILNYSLHLRSYTPGLYLSEDNFRSIGIPFSGYIYGQYSVNGRINDNNLQIGANLGFMGPALQMGKIHNVFHNDTGEDNTNAWENQVTNRPAIHLVGKYSTNLLQTSFMMLNSETSASLGNIFTHIEQEARLILGKYQEINNSSLYNSKLRNEFGMEMFVTGSAGIRVAALNATVQSNAEDENNEAINQDRSLYNLAGFVRLGLNASMGSFTAGFELSQYRGVIDKDFQFGYGTIKLAYAFRQFHHENIYEGVTNPKR